MYAFRNNWQSCNKKKKGGKSHITISSLRAGVACCWWLRTFGSSQLCKGAAAPPCSSSNIRDMRTWGEINQAIKKIRDIERCSVSPSVNTMWASLISWINYRLLQPQKCTKSFGKISLWEERNKAFLTDKRRYNSTTHCMNGWMKNWNFLL